jgi:putative ABC transport system permease protein
VGIGATQQGEKGTEVEMATVLHELRLAVRRLRSDPGFTVVALGTLALGIGATVAMFTVVDAVMLRPLPYPRPDRLVEVLPGENANIALDDALARGTPALQSTSGLSIWSLTLTGEGEPAAVSTQFVDAGFFNVVGVRPLLGRPFRPEERDPDRSDVVILSYGMWQRRFGGDPAVIGKRLHLDGSGHQYRTVVGVMPRGFTAPLVPRGPQIEAWAPLSVAPGRSIATDSTWYVNSVIGRLRPGATVEGAAQQVRATMAGLHSEYPGIIDAGSVRAAGATGLLDSMVGDVRTPLWILLSAVGLVLLLACVNLANLLLARGDRHRQELAVRAALGAGRGRLIRQQLVESAALALLGGAAGFVVARVILALLRVRRISDLPRSGDLGLDVRVLAFALAVSVLCIIGFGLLPAVRGTSGDLRGALGAGARSPGRTVSGRRLGSALVALEVALAMVLVTGAGLLLSSLRSLHAVNPGLDVRDVLAVQLEPPAEAYKGQRAVVFYDELLQRLAAVPGVRRIGAIQLLPFTRNNWAFPYLAQGQTPKADEPLPDANFRVVTPGYFRAVGQPLLAGRDVQASDGADALAVCLINRTMAEHLWPGESALGKEIKLFGDQPLRVVGVVGDVHQQALSEAPRRELYVPLAQFPVASMVVMLRTAVQPASIAGAVRDAIHQVGADVPISDLRPLRDVLEESLARERFFAGVLGFFGVLALALGAVGVYGVMAYQIGARRGEYGVRLALGATHGAIVRGALASGLVSLAIGVALGLAGAFAATRLLSSLLYGVGAMDPPTVAGAALVLGSIAMAAVWIPARRVARIHPAQVLRSD